MQVLQAVAPAGDARVAPKLAVELEPPGGATALMARLQAEAARPFDLFKDHTLMRALVLQSGPEESTVLVCVHHAGARQVTFSALSISRIYLHCNHAIRGPRMVMRRPPDKPC